MAKEGKVIISYDTANGMDCCNDKSTTETAQDVPRYDTANGMDCCNCTCALVSISAAIVTIPRTVWTVATTRERKKTMENKRYDTANGMDCCNLMVLCVKLLAILKLRYRERYGLLQPHKGDIGGKLEEGYDTANGMDCCNYFGGSGWAAYMGLRYRERYGLLQRQEHDGDGTGRAALRYRERYGLLQLHLCACFYFGRYCYDTANGMDCCNY